MRLIAVTAAAFWLVPCAALALAHHEKTHEYEPMAAAMKSKTKAKPKPQKPKKEEYLRAAPYR